MIQNLFYIPIYILSYRYMPPIAYTGNNNVYVM
jgi:hypothetical protein